MHPSAVSLSVDILFFLAGAVLMVIEARKHQIKFVWAYILGGVFIAIGVAIAVLGLVVWVDMA